MFLDTPQVIDFLLQPDAQPTGRAAESEERLVAMLFNTSRYNPLIRPANPPPRYPLPATPSPLPLQQPHISDCLTLYVTAGRAAESEERLVAMLFNTSRYNPLIRPANPPPRSPLPLQQPHISDCLTLYVTAGRAAESEERLVAMLFNTSRYNPLIRPANPPPRSPLPLQQPHISDCLTLYVTAGRAAESEERLVAMLFNTSRYNPLIRPARTVNEVVTVNFRLSISQLISVLISA
ncbi:CHRNB2 [Branchiostoma lanceolatum]|uniref:CHRNB2 protein n=1 Tax=Branchiostoma lanceolatum TaxID=7740 RepID=A0A8J9ZG44_BRALA|nr:CHRNB2 [Branchiostoma lanceolatum]